MPRNAVAKATWMIGCILLVGSMVVRTSAVLPESAFASDGHGLKPDVPIAMDDGSLQPLKSKHQMNLSGAEARLTRLALHVCTGGSWRFGLTTWPAACTLESGKQLISIRSSSCL